MGSLLELEPTWVVVLTPPGVGAVASLRVCGPRAREWIERGWLRRPGAGGPLGAAGRLSVGRWGRADGEELVLGCMGPDAFELHCHGGAAAVAAIIESLVAWGAELRCWQDQVGPDGCDSLAAEAEIALRQCVTRRAAEVLLDQRNGALRRAVDRIGGNLAAGNVGEARDELETLLGRADFGSRLTTPWRVVIAGRPNAGKSSLLNRLVGYERAIVFAEPGTTRDALSATTAIDGWPVELCDTAGLRAAGDVIEAAGIALAERRAASADLVILVRDRSLPFTPEDAALAAAYPRALCVLNKSDLPSPEPPEADALSVSARTGVGLAELVAQVGRRLVPDPPPPDAAIPFTSRQVEEILSAATSLGQGDLSAAAAALARLRQMPQTPRDGSDL